MSDVPFLNYYKLPFVKRRLLQSIFGGLRLNFPQKVPYYIYITQIILFFVPVIIGLPFTVLASYDLLRWDIGCYISGALYSVTIFILNIIVAVIRAKHTSVGPLTSSRMDLDEEDEIEFSGCCHSSTADFLFAAKSFRVNYFIHPLIGGVVLAGSVWFLNIKQSETLFASTSWAIAYGFFGWLTVCFGLYSLGVMHPEEVAIYRKPDVFDELALSRSFHMALCITVHVCAQHLAGFSLPNQIAHGLFAGLPLLWSLGLLPHLEPFVLWTCEQLLIHAFGGSAMASGLRIIFMLVASVTVLLAIIFINSSLARIILASLFGYFLAIDLGGLGARLLECCCVSPLQRERTIHVSGFLWRWRAFEVLFHCLMGGLSVGLSTGMHVLLTDVTLKANIGDYFGKATLGLLSLEVLLCEMQKVYVLFGMLRNPLFPKCLHLPETFQKNKRFLRGLGYVRRVCINYVSPTVLLVYLTNSVTLQGSWLVMLAEWRAYRSVWQSTDLALVDAAIQVTTRLALPANSSWISLGVGLNLMIIAVVRSRTAELLGKCYAYSAILFTSYAYRKQRRANSGQLVLLNLVLFPLVLAILVISTALSAPCLPLFTLPVMLIGFPRPAKFWPAAVGDSESKCDDTAIYRQLTPALVRSLREAFSNGTLSWSRNGSFFLIRFHDRLVWITVLESGYAFCSINVKGLELQTTSCHVQEVSRIDDLADVIGMDASKELKTWRNPAPLHAWSVKDTLQFVTYSDASNQLTGIIDNEEFIKSFPDAVIKTLTWLLLRQLSSDGPTAKKAPARVNSQSSVRMNPAENMTTPAWASPNNEHRDDLLSLDSMASVRSRESNRERRLSDWSDSASDDFVDGGSPKRNQGPSLGRRNLLEELDSHRVGELGLPPVEVLSASRRLPPLRTTRSHIGDTDIGGAVLGGLGLSASSSRRHESSGGDQRIPTDFKFNGGHFSLPKDWGDLPMASSRSRGGSNTVFQREWFIFCLRNLPGVSAEVFKDLSSDSRLLDCTSQLVALLSDILFGNRDALSVKHIFNVYCDKLSWQAGLEWLDKLPELRALSLRAWRYATKICLDQVIMGALESSEEFEELLLEYEREWYIGSEAEPAWLAGINCQKPNLFSLSYDNTLSIYRSRTLSLQQCIAPVGSLNRELVRAMWANLNLELLFMTNDDEERYSIQAQPSTLRNLTVQAADPPLGYPIFSSPPISVPRI